MPYRATLCPGPRSRRPSPGPLALLLPLLLALLPASPLAGLQEAPDGAEAAEEAEWLRYPAISPDGGAIAFTYRGDLYRVPADGGEAMPLTTHTGHDFRPVWSPDGRSIAFAGHRHGNFNVFVVPAEGGEVRRLTWHSADEFPYAFTPDGDSVLFGSERLNDAEHRGYPTGHQSELYRAPVDGGRALQVLTTPAEEVSVSRDGSFLLYHDRKGGEDRWRKYQRSAITRDIWRFDAETGEHRQLTDDEWETRQPVLAEGDGAFYYLSEESGSFNVHRMDLETGERGRVTDFDGAPVRFLSAADDGTLAFGHDGRLYTLDPDEGEPREVPVTIRADRRTNDERVIPVTDGLDEFAVSPDGREVAFVHRRDVFVTSVESGATKRITSTPGREVGVQFSPDGDTLLYASERDGRWGIHEATRGRDEEPYFFASTVVEEERIPVDGDPVFQPTYSPDGERIAFVEDLNTLRVLDRESGEVTTLLTEEHIFATGPTHQFEWSPDGEWIAFAHAVPGIAPREIGVVRADGSGEVVNLTRSGFNEVEPSWVMGGKAILWRSNRDGMRALAKAGATEMDAYAMFLDAEAWDRFQLDPEEFALLQEDEEDEEEGSGSEGAEGDDPVELDLDGARERQARLTIHSSPMSDALLSEDGEHLYYLARFEGGLNLWTTEVRTRETRMLAELDAGSARMRWDGEKETLFVLADGRLSTVDPESGDREAVPIDGEMVVSRTAEWEAMFDQVWRRTRDTFYRRDFHGTDWEAVREDYERFLPHIGNHHEFAELLGEMLGELNVSHSGARYTPSEDGDDATASLGIYYDRSEAREGIRVTEVMDGGPLDRDDLEVAPGDVIEAIDGEALEPDVEPARLLNRKADRNVLLRIRRDGETREAVVQPVTQSEERELRYRRWVERNRQEVEEMSDGRLGYVHVPGMNDAAYRTAFEEAMGRYPHAEGLVVDTRYNTGGDLVADLEMFLSGRRFFDYTTDTRSSGFEPHFRWTEPSVVLANEANYSDGHCFAFAYQRLGIGPLVGMPVPGTCTWAGGQSLLEDLWWGVPGRAVKDAESDRFLENWQTEPDVRVRNEPGETSGGRDAQLERAVDELLRRVDG